MKYIQELFIAADWLNAAAITQACSVFLEEQLAPQNCIGIWRFTNNYSTPELKHKAYLFMLNHFEEVAATSEEFLLLSVQELVKIIDDDRLGVKKEKMVFEAVLRWIAYAPMHEFISLPLSNVSEGQLHSFHYVHFSFASFIFCQRSYHEYNSMNGAE